MPLRRSLRSARASTSKETENPKPEMETFSSPHPLLIPNIASEIFGYLSHLKLKNCRLVCQTWNNVASKHFEKKTQIVFDSEERLTEFLDYYTVENPPIFKSYKFTGNIGVQSNGFKMFLDRFGVSHVRCIHFDHFNFVVENESHMFNVFKSVRGMEELALDYRNCSLTSGPKITKETWYFLDKLKVFRCVFNVNLTKETETKCLLEILITLYLASPRLELISSMLKSDKRRLWNYPLQDTILHPENLLIHSGMENSIATDWVIALSLVHHLNTISCVPILENFAHHESFLPLPCVTLQLMNMNSKHFQLKTLNLCIFDLHEALGEIFQQSITVLQALLSRSSPTLETLKLSFGFRRDEFGMAEMGYHNFPALKNLAIHGSTKTSHLNYINGCPNLETLHVAQAMLPSDFQEFTITPPLAKLRSFIGHDINMEGRVSCENILVAKIALEFPYLRRLKLDHVEDTSFRVICKELNLLEELFVLNSNVTDSGVTGISKSVLGKLASKSGVNKPVFKKRLPYIGDLKNLRHIEIGSTGITDLSIFHGILDCAAVRKLTIYSPKMTGKGLRCIVDKMDLLALRTVCCYAIPERVIQYARSQLADPENVILNGEKGPKNSTEVRKVIESCCVAHLEMPRQ